MTTREPETCVAEGAGPVVLTLAAGAPATTEHATPTNRTRGPTWVINRRRILWLPGAAVRPAVHPILVRGIVAHRWRLLRDVWPCGNNPSTGLNGRSNRIGRRGQVSHPRERRPFDSELSRRDFLKKSAGAAAAVSGVGALLAAA